LKLNIYMVDIREMNALIEQHSNFVTNLTAGMDKTIVGQKHLVVAADWFVE